MSLTADKLREILNYEPETGAFTRRVTRWKWHAGEAAGSVNSHGYIFIGIDRKRYLAHRLAWLWMTGEWPSAEIDHVNCNPSDNRWGNLRPASRCQNASNVTLPRTNTSGHKGVTWNKQNKKWQAQIDANGRHINLGFFDDIKEAAAARASAARKYHREFARTA